jgi:cyanophycin synthetase
MMDDLEGRLLRLKHSWGARLRPAVRRRAAGFQALRTRFYAELWSEVGERVGATIDVHPRGFVRLRRAGRTVWVRGPRVPFDDPVTLALAGDKPTSARVLDEAGLPVHVPFEFSLATLDAARARLESGSGPVVVKPAVGGAGGAGVVTGIRNAVDLRRAARWASVWGHELLLEPQVEGHSLRMLYLDGRFIDAVRRDPPQVLGDGATSIARLIEGETAARLEADPVRALSPLDLDLDSRLALAGAGTAPESVPQAGEAIAVKRVVNQNRAAENHRLSDVHPAVVDLGRRAAQALGVRLAGVDLIAADPTRSPEEAEVVVSEVNTTPGLHHHVLVSRSGDRDVPAEIIETLLDEESR